MLIHNTNLLDSSAFSYSLSKLSRAINDLKSFVHCSSIIITSWNSTIKNHNLKKFFDYSKFFYQLFFPNKTNTIFHWPICFVTDQIFFYQCSIQHFEAVISLLVLTLHSTTLSSASHVWYISSTARLRFSNRKAQYLALRSPFLFNLPLDCGKK